MTNLTIDVMNPEIVLNQVENPALDPVILAKVTAMTVLLISSLTAGLIPFGLAHYLGWIHDSNSPTSDGHQKSKGGQIVPILLSLGGGVLLCTTFMHLLPEVTENIQLLQAQKQLPIFPFHLAEFLMCIGFFTMYLVEQLVHCYIRSRQKMNTHTNAVQTTPDQKRNSCISSIDLIENDVENAKYQEYNNSHSHLQLPTDSENLDKDKFVSSLRGLLIVLALSVHELFEGLAVGLEGSASNVWFLFGAVAAHKLVLAFCVGIELIVAKTYKWLAFVYIITFSVVSPIGIGIGIFVSHDATSSTNLVSVLLQGLATGTLLYVVFFEILQKNKGHHDDEGNVKPLLQFAAIIIGFTIMFALQFLCKFLLFITYLFSETVLHT